MLEHIKNFYLVSANLATAGQPSEADFTQLAQAGYQTVINLAVLNKNTDLSDEATLVNALGMDYFHLPVVFQSPQSSDLQAFFQIMDNLPTQKILVHCVVNYRALAFVALYAHARLDWTLEQVYAHAEKFWQLDSVWSAFVAENILNNKHRI